MGLPNTPTLGWFGGSIDRNIWHILCSVWEYNKYGLLNGGFGGERRPLVMPDRFQLRTRDPAAICCRTRETSHLVPIGVGEDFTRGVRESGLWT